MKKIIGISLLMIFCLSVMAIAVPDLVVNDFTITGNALRPGEYNDFTLKIKNIGDEAAKTRLPASIYFESESKPMYPGSLMLTLASGRGAEVEVVRPTIIHADGTSNTVEPTFETVEYMAAPETPEEIQKRKDNFLIRAEGLDYSQEQIDQEWKAIEDMFSKPHSDSTEGWFITLASGDIVVYSSIQSYNNYGALNVPLGKLDSNPTTQKLTVLLDPDQEADGNLANNEFVTELNVASNVLQGPAPETPKNKELKDATEYFSKAAGCTIINNKNVCLQLDEKEEIITISVDDESKEYNMYGLFMSWLNKWFGDGKLAPTETLNGVEVTLYDTGFLLNFKE